jgi:hypothetical protein
MLHRVYQLQVECSAVDLNGQEACFGAAWVVPRQSHMGVPALCRGSNEFESSSRPLVDVCECVPSFYSISSTRLPCVCLAHETQLVHNKYKAIPRSPLAGAYLCLCDGIALPRGFGLTLSHGCGRRVALRCCAHAALAFTSQLCVSTAPPASFIPPVSAHCFGGNEWLCSREL